MLGKEVCKFKTNRPDREDSAGSCAIDVGAGDESPAPGACRCLAVASRSE